MVLLTWIAEITDEPLVLEPADRQAEAETNTWWLSVEDEDRSLSVSDVLVAFERTADAIRSRIRRLGFQGAATFYVWHDLQAGQLRCSTGSVSADELPFGSVYAVSDDLGSVIEAFLVDNEPGFIGWSDLAATQSRVERAVPDPEVAPFLVWARSVGTAP